MDLRCSAAYCWSEFHGFRELFRLLKKRPTFDDVNVKNGIGREILMSVFYSAVLKFFVSRCICSWIPIIGQNENIRIIATFALALLSTIVVFLLSKVDFLMEFFVRFLGISPSYSIWNTLLEGNPYIHYETVRNGKNVTIQGKARHFEVDKDGGCHVALDDYSVVDNESLEVIFKSENAAYEYYIMLHSKDIKNLVIKRKKSAKQLKEEKKKLEETEEHDKSECVDAKNEERSN